MECNSIIDEISNNFKISELWLQSVGQIDYVSIYDFINSVLDLGFTAPTQHLGEQRLE